MKHDDMIAVIQAHKDGKQIEFRESSDAGWSICGQEPSWNFQRYEYRAKPVPRELWLAPTGKCRDLDEYVDAGNAETAERFLDVIHVREVMP